MVVQMFKEKTWVRLYYLAIVFVGLAFLLWSHGHLFEARLGITLAVVEIPIIVFGAVVANLILRESLSRVKEIEEGTRRALEKVQGKDTTKRENHTKELNEKLFKRLATITIREDSRHGDYGLYVEKDNSQDDARFASIKYAREDRTVIPIDKLPVIHYVWALRHLEHEDYSNNILKPFFELQELINQYNEEQRLYRQTIEEKIENVISKSFEDCSIFPKAIRERLDIEMLRENSNQKFDDLIIDKISNHYGIMPRGYPPEHPFIICKTISEKQLEQFKTILKSIIYSKEFLDTNKIQSTLLFKRIDPLLKELSFKLHLLSDELGASGSVIKGKCQWEETNLSSDSR
jgi:hypothetical protein